MQEKRSEEEMSSKDRQKGITIHRLKKNAMKEGEKKVKEDDEHVSHKRSVKASLLRFQRQMKLLRKKYDNFST